MFESMSSSSDGPRFLLCFPFKLRCSVVFRAWCSCDIHPAAQWWQGTALPWGSAPRNPQKAINKWPLWLKLRSLKSGFLPSKMSLWVPRTVGIAKSRMGYCFNDVPSVQHLEMFCDISSLTRVGPRAKWTCEGGDYQGVGMAAEQDRTLRKSFPPPPPLGERESGGQWGRHRHSCTVPSVKW